MVGLVTEHNAPNGTIYFHNAALSEQAHSRKEGEPEAVQEGGIRIQRGHRRTLKGNSVSVGACTNTEKRNCLFHF